jgi:hypothetical protein
MGSPLNCNNSITIKKTIMKKSVILTLTLALGLFLISCKNSNKQPEARSGKSETKVSAQVSAPGILCTSYSIFNPHSPTGPAVEYSYVDCNGGSQSGWLNPQETVGVLAEQGSVKCPGGVVSESGISSKTSPTDLKP